MIDQGDLIMSTLKKRQILKISSWSDATEFMNRVNDQVRKRQKNSNVAGDGEEHSIIGRMFMPVTMESAVFMGKNFKTIVIPL